jgi:hypothetical protein
VLSHWRLSMSIYTLLFYKEIFMAALIITITLVAVYAQRRKVYKLVKMIINEYNNS